MRALRASAAPSAALVAVAAVWGATFVIVADAIERYPMFAFLALRFALASLAFVLLFPRAVRRLDSQNLSKGMFAGLFLALGYIFQTWGLDGPTRTTPARAAFITGLYVVIVPLAQALVMHRRPRAGTVIGAAVAVAGLWVLSGAGGARGAGWVMGDALVLVCTVAYSAHMLVLGTTDERHDTSALTLVQLLVVTAVSSVISLGLEDAGFPDARVIWAIVVCGVFASALAFAAQTWAQRRLPPARVALVLVTEPAFGGLFGWTVAGSWPLREVAGAAMMLAGMLVSEASELLRKGGAPTALELAPEGIPVPDASPSASESSAHGRPPVAIDRPDGRL